MANAVAIIDYGSGNLRSAAKAFERAAAETGAAWTVRVTDHAADLDAASHIVLPGVGAFADCRAGLHAVPGMVEALLRAVVDEAKPFFGICVGMQLMASRGLEHGTHDGFGWIAGDVDKIAPCATGGIDLKIPHMGWNDLALARAHPVLDGIADGDHAYFVHSYALAPSEGADLLATVDYGGPVTAMVGRDNFVGTQFHPEKSQATGLRLIRNFLSWRP